MQLSCKGYVQMHHLKNGRHSFSAVINVHFHFQWRTLKRCGGQHDDISVGKVHKVKSSFFKSCNVREPSIFNETESQAIGINETSYSQLKFH